MLAFIVSAPHASIRLQDIAKRDHQRRMASMSAWSDEPLQARRTAASDEELRLLDKACTKFPMGTPRRCGPVLPGQFARVLVTLRLR